MTERLVQPGDEITLGANARMVFRIRGHSTEPARGSEGYLDATEEWEPQLGSRDSVPRFAADRPPEAVPAGTPSPRPSPTAGASQVGFVGSGSVVTRRRRGLGHVRGVARAVQFREIPRGQDFRSQESVLAFRVDRYDGSGNRLEPVAVELRNYRGGEINEGEEVEVTGQWSHGTLRARKIVNLSTQSEVLGPPRAAKVAGLCIALLVLGLFVFVAYDLITNHGGP